jgi:hypothetical protein
MFKRLLNRKGSSETESAPLPPPSTETSDIVRFAPILSMNEIGVQVEVPVKTVGTLTAVVGKTDTATATENLTAVEVGTSPERVAFYDQVVQCASTYMDAAVDPGEWNYGVFRGIECQTDCPDYADPLMWLSGSFDDTSKFLSRLIDRLERDEFGTTSLQEEVDILKLRADNVLLRIELNTLKRKLHGIDESSSQTMDTRRIQRETLAALAGRSAVKIPFIVTSEAGATVTANLAPSSAPLGILKKGDRILLCGHPEEICGLIRGPILPRGWVTLSDRSHIYLSKSA